MEIVEFGPVLLAHAEHRGSYNKVGKAISAFFKRLGKQDIEFTGSLMGILYDSPEEVPEGTEVAGPLGVKIIPGCLVARGLVPVGPAIKAYAAMPTSRSIQSTIMFVVRRLNRIHNIERMRED